MMNMMTRLEYIRSMSAEEMAKEICERSITDKFCKSDCEWSQSLEYEQDRSDCIKCCVRWLNEQVVF